MKGDKKFPPESSRLFIYMKKDKQEKYFEKPEAISYIERLTHAGNACFYLLCILFSSPTLFCRSGLNFPKGVRMIVLVLLKYFTVGK